MHLCHWQSGDQNHAYVLLVSSDKRETGESYPSRQEDIEEVQEAEEVCFFYNWPVSF